MSCRRAGIPRPFLSRLLPALLVGWFVLPAWADTGAVSEYAIKAVLFYKLPQFVYLPDTARARDGDSATTLCGLGEHPVVDALERLAQSPPQGRAPAYRTVDGVGGTGHCDLLFIAGDEADRLDGILNRLRDKNLVTVSDIPGFAKAGGMVEFSRSPEKAGVQILINRKAAQKLGIEFNAQLLRLARIVEP